MHLEDLTPGSPLTVLCICHVKFLKIAGLEFPSSMFGSVGSPTTVTSRVQRELRDSAHRDYGVRC